MTPQSRSFFKWLKSWLASYKLFYPTANIIRCHSVNFVTRGQSEPRSVYPRFLSLLHCPRASTLLFDLIDYLVQVHWLFLSRPHFYHQSTLYPPKQHHFSAYTEHWMVQLSPDFWFRASRSIFLLSRYSPCHFSIGRVHECNLQLIPYHLFSMFGALRTSLTSDRRSRKAVYAVFKLPIYLRTTQIPRYGNCVVFGVITRLPYPARWLPRFMAWVKYSSLIDSFL